jgi:MFS family permease
LSKAEKQSDEGEGSWAEVLTGRYGIYTLVLNLGVTLFGINQFVVATVMPTVVADLGGIDYYTWAFSLFAVGSIIGAAGAGPLRDAVGIRNAYVGAGLMLALGLAGSAMATSMPGLVGWRLVQGIGGGAISSLAYAIVASTFPARLRSRELSIVSTIWGIATVAGPGLGALFAAPGLWRGAFWSLMVLTLLFAWLAWRHVEGETGHGQLSRLPWQRLGLLALAVLLMSATTLTSRGLIQVLLVASAVAAAWAAFARDAKAERSIFPRRATDITSEIGATYWIFFLVSVVLAFTNTYTTFYLQRLHDIAPLTAGYLFCIQSLMWTVAALFVADVRPSRLPVAVIAGVALLVLASVIVAFTVVSGPIAVIATALFISGVGMGILNNPAIQHIMGVASDRERPIAGASVQAVRNIGISFGAAGSGLVAASAGLVDNAPRETVVAAMQWVFGANVVLSLAALGVAMLMLLRRPTQPGRAL